MDKPRGRTSKQVRAACQRLESLLGSSQAFRKVEDNLYILKQGSSVVMISVHPWRRDHAVLRLTAQLVSGVTMEVPLALELLQVNAILRFGSFA